MTQSMHQTKELRTNSKGELRQVITTYINEKKVSIIHYEAIEMRGELHIIKDYKVYNKVY